MNEEMPKIVNQRLQKEYLIHLKNSGVAIGTIFIITIAIVTALDYILL